MIGRVARLTAFELRKLLARRLAIVAVPLVAAVAALSPWAGRVIDTAGALSRGHAAEADPFKNGWTALAGGISAALPFAVVIVLVFAGSALAEEAQLGTLKSLLVRPVRRTELLLAKALALVAFSLALIAAMSGAAVAVAQALYGFGDIVDYSSSYRYPVSDTIPRYTAQAIALLVPSFVAVVAWALLCSASIDHTGYAVGAAIGGFLLLVVIAGLWNQAAPALFVTYVGRPISTLRDIAEVFSDAPKRFRADLVPGVMVPVISAALFLAAAAVRLARRDVGD